MYFFSRVSDLPEVEVSFSKGLIERVEPFVVEFSRESRDQERSLYFYISFLKYVEYENCSRAVADQDGVFVS